MNNSSTVDMTDYIRKEDFEKAVQDLQFASTTLWVMVAAILVFFMQAGFTLLEVGTVRAKNAQGIMLKNMLDSCISATCWWVLGYGLAFGDDSGSFLGGNYFFAQHKQLTYGNDRYLQWFFQWAFCATAATIVSGALAERVKLTGYSIFAVLMTAIIYPLVVHWTWTGDGFLSGLGYTDFAGSGVVHLCGGVAALVGASVIGPRKGRFEQSTSPVEFAPHNMPLVVTGTFILWFGWYGFNAGSTFSMAGGDDAVAVARVAVATTLAATTCGLAVFWIHYFVAKEFDVGKLTNGILGGLVSITAGCDNVDTWAAVVIGFLGGAFYYSASYTLKKLHVDDPLDAFAVHGACGIWGVIAVGFFNLDSGVLYGHADSGKFLGVQLLAILVIIAWTGGLSAIAFLILKQIGCLRLGAREEEQGGDVECPTKTYDFGMKV